MRRELAVVATAAAFLAASGTALANHSRPYEGTVRSVDPQSDMVTLEDGTTFRAADGVGVDGLEPGTEVIFYYHTYDGQKTVVSYELPGTDLSTQPAAGQ